jgi:glycosyltransferase involved in cell wall biosynthesis/Tfp pilus assembly protein PilF
VAQLLVERAPESAVPSIHLAESACVQPDKNWPLEEQIAVLKSTGLLDPDWYLAKFSDVRADGIDPFEHFCRFGWKEHRNPNFYFDTAYYELQMPQHQRGSLNPVLHYLNGGEAGNLKPSIFFDPSWYRIKHVLDPEQCALAHYLGNARPEKLSPIPEFEPDFYSRHNNVPAEADAFRHYIEVGFRTGARPSEHFDSEFYSLRYQLSNSKNPLCHYLENRTKYKLQTKPEWLDDVILLRRAGEPARALARLQEVATEEAILESWKAVKAALEYLWLKDDHTAEILINRVLKVDPKHFYALLTRLYIHRDRQAGEEAEASAKQLLQLHPKQVTGRYEAAKQFYLNGKRDDARQQVSAALELDPAHLGSLKLKAEILVDLDDEAAAEALEQVIAKEASEANLFRLGRHYLHLKSYPSANAVVRRLRDLFPSGQTADKLAEQIETLIDEVLSQVTAGTPETKEILRRFTERSDLLSKKQRRTLAAAHLMTGDLVAAKSLCDEILRTDPADTDVWLIKAQTSDQKNCSEDTIEILRDGLKQAQNPALMRVALAECFQKSGRHEDALLELDFALAVEPGHMKARQARAMLAKNRSSKSNVSLRLAELGASASQPIAKSVSVVIPTFNAGNDFYWLLRKLKSQKGLPSLEIVIVDSGSTDGTDQLAKQMGCIVISIPNKLFTHSFARNLGADLATGDLLLFIVQDAYPIGDYWICSLADRLLHPPNEIERVDALSCAEFPRVDSELLYDFMIWVHYRFLGCIESDRIGRFVDIDHQSLRSLGQLSDVACLIPIDLFRKYRYYGRYAEDLLLGVRLLKDGYKLGMLSSLKVIHSHMRSTNYYFRRTFVDTVFLAHAFQDFSIPPISSVSAVLSAGEALIQSAPAYGGGRKYCASEALDQIIEHYLSVQMPTSTKEFVESTYDLAPLQEWLRTHPSRSGLFNPEELRDVEITRASFIDRLRELRKFVLKTESELTDGYVAELRAAVEKLLAQCLGSLIAIHCLSPKSQDRAAAQLKDLMMAGI